MAGFKLSQLGSRILRAVTPLALSASLIASGCDAHPQPEVSEATVELRASNTGPSAAMVEHGEEIAAAIVADEAFVELVEVSASVMSDLRDAQMNLSDERIDAIATTTSKPSFGEVMGPSTLLKKLGGDPADLDQMRYLVGELVENHGLQKASPQDVSYAFELAFDVGGAGDIVDAAVHGALKPWQFNACEQACYNAHFLTMTVVIPLFVIAVAVAVVTFPLGAVLLLFAISALNLALAKAEAALNLCLAECDGVVIMDTPDMCGDEVCDKDEYCWTGVLGIGQDECRPLRSQKRVCSGDHQCESGCCKLHVWTNPISNTCRPANACN